MNNGIRSFIGKGLYIETAVADATQQANAWLVTHRWMDAAGNSAYVLRTQAMPDDGGWIYIMHLIGNMDEH
jgi:hypothetical protein